MVIDTAQIKELRQLTSLRVMECKRVLEQAGGDIEKAQALLAERAAEKASEKSDREVKQGIIDAYIHGDGRIGVLLEVLCETDFLARSETFRRLVKDIALQIASENPLYISADEVPAEVIGQVECEAEKFARLRVCLTVSPSFRGDSWDRRSRHSSEWYIDNAFGALWSLERDRGPM
jgi:translation elongation factor EF-Ts